MSDDRISINMGAAATTASAAAPKDASYGRAILFGIGAAVLGGVAWFLVAKFFDLQHSGIAIGIGALVGLTMRSQLHGRSIPLGLVAAVLSVAGIVFGHVLIWQYIVPQVVINEVKKYDPETALTAAEVHKVIPFIEYMKNDLGLDEPSYDERGKQSKRDILSWFFYALALYVGFASVVKRQQVPAPKPTPTPTTL